MTKHLWEAKEKKTMMALERFNLVRGEEEPDPLERLRFFCSLAMNGQDWLDSEQFFDDVEKLYKGDVTHGEENETDHNASY